jgi:hypothetical protein
VPHGGGAMHICSTSALAAAGCASLAVPTQTPSGQSGPQVAATDLNGKAAMDKFSSTEKKEAGEEERHDRPEFVGRIIRPNDQFGAKSEG